MILYGWWCHHGWCLRMRKRARDSNENPPPDMGSMAGIEVNSPVPLRLAGHAPKYYDVLLYCL
jgi:hypothetical protein